MSPSFQRPMNPGEEAAVERLLQRAFKGSAEAQLGTLTQGMQMIQTFIPRYFTKKHIAVHVRCACVYH